ncbi:ABC transporter permease [Thermopolyspora sp. NPDC052614]|uniref:ABC transporter permease n=1 Tax=Thermopolyspora sp. NPDC052614 TaxID=3155682 RepID=UPI00341DBB17
MTAEAVASPQGAAPPQPGPDRRRVLSPAGRRRAAGLLLLLPALIALTVFFVLPLVSIVVDSFVDPDPTLENYAQLFTDGYTLRVLGRTLVVALVVTVAGVVFAYPYTYMMTLAGPTTRAVMVTVVLVPFWTSMLARNFAWMVLMQDGGVVQGALGLVGLGGTRLLGTTFAVTVSMTQVLLPFMVLPMYSVMQQIDRRLLLAGQSLGAGRLSSFWKVYFPLSLPGVVAGASLGFVLALGFYVTPALLGSPQNALIAQVISTRTRDLLDFGGGGAMGVFMLVVTLAVLAASRALTGRGTAVSAGQALPGGNER